MTPDQIREGRILTTSGEGSDNWEIASDTQAILREMAAQIAAQNILLERIASALEGLENRK